MPGDKIPAMWTVTSRQPSLGLDAPVEPVMVQAVYPISKLLQQILTDSGLRRSQFIQAIGFKNQTKGLKRLDEWLGTGRGHKVCLERIVDRYHPDPAALQSALAETEAIHKHEYQAAVHEHEERERRLFRPFLWVVTEDGAHSWVMAMAQRNRLRQKVTLVRRVTLGTA
jgi:hypothetical protein